MDTLIAAIMALGWIGVGLAGVLAGAWIWAVGQARQQADAQTAAERKLADLEEEATP